MHPNRTAIAKDQADIFAEYFTIIPPSVLSRWWKLTPKIGVFPTSLQGVFGG
jgi:hypothetical protein